MECKRRAAELFEAKLFQQPPTNEECPICMLPMPLHPYDYQYQSCCGKIVCQGCMYHVQTTKGELLCPFCRIRDPTSDKEDTDRLMKRIEVYNDAEANFVLGTLYHQGTSCLPRDDAKAMEFTFKAAKLGSNNAYNNIGSSYMHGIGGLERNLNKAKHYYELGSIGGDVTARHALGLVEMMLGNNDRAMKHWIIAANSGSNESLENVKRGYTQGHLTKDEFATCLRSHKASQDEMKSKQRDTVTKMRVPMEEFGSYP